MEIEIDPTGIEIAEQAHKMLEGSTEAADAPRRDHVKVLAGDPLHQRIETGALLSSLRSTDPFVGEGGDDVPSKPFASEPEIAKLVLDGLAVSGGHTGVDRDAFAHEEDSHG